MSGGALMSKKIFGEFSKMNKNKRDIKVNPVPSPLLPLVNELTVPHTRLSLFSAREMMQYLQHLPPSEFNLVKKFADSEFFIILSEYIDFLF
jgi:hypothetical protein